MFVRDGAVTPGPSRKCDITFFVKGRPKSARQSRDSTVAARKVQSVTVPSSRVSRECRSPGLRSPPFKNARPKVANAKAKSLRFQEKVNHGPREVNRGVSKPRSFPFFSRGPLSATHFKLWRCSERGHCRKKCAKFPPLPRSFRTFLMEQETVFLKFPELSAEFPRNFPQRPLRQRPHK